MPHSPWTFMASIGSSTKGFSGPVSRPFRRLCQDGWLWNHQVLGYENQDDLRKKIYSIAFRIDEHDIKAVQGLPEYVDIRRPVILSAYAKKLYQVLKSEFVVGWRTAQ